MTTRLEHAAWVLWVRRSSIEIRPISLDTLRPYVPLSTQSIGTIFPSQPASPSHPTWIEQYFGTCRSAYERGIA